MNEGLNGIILQNNDILKLKKNGIKVIHLQHHVTFLKVCSEFNVIPSGLVIKKSPTIYPTTNKFKLKCRNIIKNAEKELVVCLLDQNKINLKNRIDELCNRFKNITKENKDVSELNLLLENFTALERTF